MCFCNYSFFFLKFVIATKAEGTGRGRGRRTRSGRRCGSLSVFEVWKTSAEDPFGSTTVNARELVGDFFF